MLYLRTTCKISDSTIIYLNLRGYQLAEKKKIFREVSLERLSSPEQLDQSIQIVSPKGWLTIIGIGVLLLAVLLWGFFGSIPINIFGHGIIMYGEGIFSIISRGEGIVEEIFVNIGDNVNKGQTIAKITQTGLMDTIQKDEKILNELKKELQEINKEYEEAANLLEENTISEMQYFEIEDRISSKRIQIFEVEGRIKSNKDMLSEISEIKSPYSGIIFEMDLAEGMFVEKNKPIGRIDLLGSQLQAILYFSPSDGKKIEKNMKSQISPTTVKKEEYGFINGSVEQVSLYPMSEEALMHTLQNELLVSEIAATEAPIEVRVNLIEDSNTPSGFKWSSSTGPSIEIHSGTMCSGSVTIAKQSPISLVIPFLKND
jgi:regulator of replication initiation timing